STDIVHSTTHEPYVTYTLSLHDALPIYVTEAANDKQQAEPVAQATLATLSQAGLERPKDASGAVQAIPATLDNGYYSEAAVVARSEEHTSELQSRFDLVCRLLLEKKNSI